MKKYKIIISAALCVISVVANAKVTLPAIFADNMVLQQQTACNLWGIANADKQVKVTTSWDGHTYKVTADKNGKFSLQVQTPVAGGPYDILFDDGEKIRIHDVFVGEVWICSGQSNMEMPMKGFKGQPVDGVHEELMSGGDDKMRLFTVKRNAQLLPQYDVLGKWDKASSGSIREFSATAYYFGKYLRRNLNVPVGLIVTAFGGSACETWMTAEWLKAFPQAKLPKTQADVDKTKQRCPTALYNGMLYPLIGYTMKGVIWYQGEDNVNRASYYADLFSTMIRGWRSEWKQGDFPFYYCQIAPYDYTLIDWHYNSAYLREQQAKVEQVVDNCRMAVLMDAGLEYGIHPRKKKVAGERLAMLALGNTYGFSGMPDYAVYKNVTFQNDTADVVFDRSKEWIYFQNGTTSNNFEICGADSVYYPAKVWISRNHLYAKSDKVKHPVAVRYGFKDWVQGDLMHDGLPVSSFRTDK